MRCVLSVPPVNQCESLRSASTLWYFTLTAIFVRGVTVPASNSYFVLNLVFHTFGGVILETFLLYH